MTNYESFYSGNSYLLDPNYNFSGYRISAGDLGATTSIQTANQLKEVNNLLNQGLKVTEVSTIDPNIFEMMPKDHLKEIHRLNKLTGAESTLHAPILDPSGFDQQSGWSEENRKNIEEQFKGFVKRSHELNPQGNTPVTIHASLVPGSQMIPNKEKNTEEMKQMIAVDQETGKLIPLEREKLYGPEEPKGKLHTPKERLDMANNSSWIQSITNLAFYKKEADEILNQAMPSLQPLLDKIERKQKISKEEERIYLPSINQMQRGQLFLDNVKTSFRNLFEKAAKFSLGNDEEKKQTEKILNQISNNFLTLKKEYQKNNLSQIEYVQKQSLLLDESIRGLQMIPTSPKQYIPVEKFIMKNASETLSSVAFDSYKNFKDTSPIISIENPPYGSAISSGKDLKELVCETRNKFVNKLINQGRSKQEAKKIAEKLIGVTWDTSHINLMRKQGFGPEKIIEETKKIAPYVKHLHLNDNFGTTHTDLPPGMGNVPMKKVMQELEKAKFKGKKIFEGGNFFQQFKTSPLPYQLESSGSPVFSGGNVYWNQLGNFGNYDSGTGPINPQVHHSLYGTSFSNLPIELGGEITGARNRFSGTSNT